VTAAHPTVRVRAVLATPAIFDAGALPGPASAWFSRTDVKVRVVSSVTGRPMTVSGWDLKERRPKPSRRLGSAGAVYWLELDGTPQAREVWLDHVWLRNASCAEQDARNGYGLTLIGVA
jgi:CRISPR-associated protein Cmr3